MLPKACHIQKLHQSLTKILVRSQARIFQVVQLRKNNSMKLILKILANKVRIAKMSHMASTMGLESMIAQHTKKAVKTRNQQLLKNLGIKSIKIILQTTWHTNLHSNNTLIMITPARKDPVENMRIKIISTLLRVALRVKMALYNTTKECQLPKSRSLEMKRHIQMMMESRKSTMLTNLMILKKTPRDKALLISSDLIRTPTSSLLDQMRIRRKMI